MDIIQIKKISSKYSCPIQNVYLIQLRSVGVGPTHARYGTLDLLMTDVPDLVRVAVAPIGNSAEVH